jgi:hypothetical protein
VQVNFQDAEAGSALRIQKLKLIFLLKIPAGCSDQVNLLNLQAKHSKNSCYQNGPIWQIDFYFPMGWPGPTLGD